jgi:hypothetical protein
MTEAGCAGRFVPDTEAHLHANRSTLTAAGLMRSDSERVKQVATDEALPFEEWLRKKTTMSVDLEINIQVQTLNPKTLNPKILNPNPKPLTQNPRPETLNPNMFSTSSWAR